MVRSVFNYAMKIYQRWSQYFGMGLTFDVRVSWPFLKVIGKRVKRKCKMMEDEATNEMIASASEVVRENILNKGS